MLSTQASVKHVNVKYKCQVTLPNWTYVYALISVLHYEIFLILFILTLSAYLNLLDEQCCGIFLIFSGTFLKLTLLNESKTILDLLMIINSPLKTAFPFLLIEYLVRFESMCIYFCQLTYKFFLIK